MGLLIEAVSDSAQAMEARAAMSRRTADADGAVTTAERGAPAGVEPYTAAAGAYDAPTATPAGQPGAMIIRIWQKHHAAACGRRGSRLPLTWRAVQVESRGDCTPSIARLAALVIGQGPRPGAAAAKAAAACRDRGRDPGPHRRGVRQHRAPCRNGAAKGAKTPRIRRRVRKAIHGRPLPRPAPLRPAQEGRLRARLRRR